MAKKGCSVGENLALHDHPEVTRCQWKCIPDHGTEYSISKHSWIFSMPSEKYTQLLFQSAFSGWPVFSFTCGRTRYTSLLSYHADFLCHLISQRKCQHIFYDDNSQLKKWISLCAPASRKVLTTACMNNNQSRTTVIRLALFFYKFIAPWFLVWVKQRKFNLKMA